MIVTLSRILVTLAARSLGSRRRGWAAAMEGELDAAIEDGRPLAFALGCLFAAWRTLAAEREGRAILAAHALAFGFILPAAAVSLLSAWYGFPYLGVGRAGLRGLVTGTSERLPLLNAGNWCAAPPLTLLVLALAVGQIALAWFLLERDWTRAHAVGRCNAAALTSLACVTALLALDIRPMLLPLMALVTETLAVMALAQESRHAGEDVLAEVPDG
ncbi:hypothetical protein GCM10011380_19550 [Sphingomonas metalli]|uniref:Uncharacterized protein n=1 Tax=Sphingomonas metalli TaxID=1779358 RepID=A0A916WT21_9SPHN|nr:hypothetical protein [Sphingomonas metalli]GGB30170.1 hypothetical protein GCM10011380_19550 [Sphingomonas metalli]